MSSVLVTGGGGFLGSHLVERLEADGHEVVAARRRDYDLTAMDDAARLFADARPELVFHLAAEVGGIGANRANPGRYWYANLVMGAHVLEQSRLHERRASSSSPAPSAPTRSSRRCRSARTTLWNGYPEETNAPYGVAKKALLVGAQAYREQYGLERDLPAAGEPLRAARQLRPRELARDPGADPEDGRGRRTRSCSGATARRRREFLYVDDCVEGLVLAAERYDGAEPVNLGTGVETSIRELAETIAEVTGFEGEIVWDTSMPNGQPRRSLDASRAAELFGFRAGTPLRDGLERTVAWYRSRRRPRTAAPRARQAARARA